ncbi:hypothetical protein SO802_019356 [Lithocarpus litseifolius]|uniref:Bromo domain-containing protein n=1 Tax=Lithocarpus litseifolius TaxID=425828 RepID=A0AAW2CQK6_9ROSI
MGREHGTSVQPWGTLEDLLLACAVIRHGTASWDSIAIELQNRSSSSSSSAATAATTTAMLGITPLYCKDKFDDLKRRFTARNDDESGRIVEELRRIRVEELKREVRRRDDSIVSLELKLKRLKEERDRSLKEEAENVDLKKDLEGDAGETTPLPENLAVSGDISDDKENRSFNESNSTTQKGEGQARNDAVKVQIRPEPERNEPDPGRTESNPVLNGEVDANENEIQDDDDDDAGEKRKLVGGIMAKPSRAGRLSESNEGLESVGESKREKETASKQSSDVQSSASLSRKKRRRKFSSSGGGSSSGEEPEVDEVSPATKRVSAVKSEPLIKLVGIIRSHRLGSVFERRLRSQESERYKKLIRQHMDLQTVQSRLERGAYADNIHKFFRDLLLIFNNGVMFFRKSSPEHVAAQELRALVRKELRNKLRKPQPRKTVKLEPKHEPDSLSKPNNKPSIATLVACGKRSSMKVLTEGANRKEDKREKVAVGEKPNVVINQKKNEGTFIKVSGEEKQGIRRKRTRERQGRRSRRTNNNKGGGGEIKHEYGGNVLSSHDALELIKIEKKKESTVKKKKQGAASFLKRMKQNSPSDQVTEDTDDVSEDDSVESKGDKEEEKKRGRKSEVRGERVTRSSTGGRGTKEENAKAKRGVGRPPKKPETVTVAAASGKRGRDNSESEVVGSASSRSRKRPRR